MPFRFHCNDAAQFTMPMRCVVCDSEDAEVVHYTQEHFPIPLLYVSIHSRTPVALPYCAYHRDAFYWRFQVLRIVQYLLIAGGFGCFIPGVLLQENVPAKEQLGMALAIVGIVCFCLLPITLIVRHFFYDAFIRYPASGVQISSKHQQFIETLRKENEGAPEVPRFDV